MVDRRVPEHSIDLRLDAAGIPPDRAPIVLRIIRLLADGQPVSSARAQVKDPEVWDDLRQLGAELGAETWLVDKPGAVVVSPDEAFRIGQETCSLPLINAGSCNC
jgi:hypothetical protein